MFGYKAQLYRQEKTTSHTKTTVYQAFIVIAMCFSFASTSLHSYFSHFEIINHSHMTIRVKRNVLTRLELWKELSFFALGRSFRLHLFPGSPVVDPNHFQAHLVDANNTFESIDVDLNDFYVGTVSGDPDTSVDATYMDGVWSAMIRTSEEIYSIEPLVKYDVLGNSMSMIAFRNSDVFNGNTSQPPCPSTPNLPTGHPLWKSATFVRRPSSKRRRRSQSADMNTICDILGIMDTYTFNGIGLKSPHRSAKMLIHWYQMVHRIFNDTKFPNFGNLNIALRAVLILKDYSPLDTSRFSFNRDPKKTSVLAKLIITHMGKEKMFGEYCLAHVTTQLETDDDVRGMALLGNNPEVVYPFWRGGLCAASSYHSKNIGFSTTGLQGSALTDAKYLVVLTHEIAHGWGSGHDNASDPECDPSVEQGGRYLMWPVVNNAIYKNNFKFSSCSIREMSAVLKHKAHLCLLPQLTSLASLCGNNIVEAGEECDELEFSDARTSCCTEQCRLKPGKTCSPSASPCCTSSCKVASSSHMCYRQYKAECQGHAYCDGVHHEKCPQPSTLPDGSACRDHGTCRNGVCLSYCESTGLMFTPPRQLLPCQCPKNDHSVCRVCCQESGTEDCLPSNSSIRDGLPCSLGGCVGGKCVKGKRSETLLAIRSQLHGLRQLESNFVIKHLVMFVIAITLPPYLLVVKLIDRADKLEAQARRASRKRSRVHSRQQKEIDLTQTAESPRPNTSSIVPAPTTVISLTESAYRST